MPVNGVFLPLITPMIFILWILIINLQMLNRQVSHHNIVMEPTLFLSQKHGLTAVLSHSLSDHIGGVHDVFNQQP